jgi:hypothetical protein
MTKTADIGSPRRRRQETPAIVFGRRQPYSAKLHLRALEILEVRARATTSRWMSTCWPSRRRRHEHARVAAGKRTMLRGFV